MNKIIKVLFYLSVLVLLVSCTTTRFEPKEGKTSALVVGRLTAKASGFEYDGDINFNRNYTMGTQLTLKEVRTGKTYEAKTIRRDGLFIFGNLNPNEKYYLYQIKYNIEQSNGWKGWITSTYKPNSFPVSVKPDSVVILGNFNCTITEVAGKIKTNLIDRDIPTDVRFSFMDIYPESKWLSKNWYYKNGLMPKVYSVDGEEPQIEEQPMEEVSEDEYDDFLKELMGE